MARPKKDKPDYCVHKPSGRAYVRIDGRFIWLGKFNSPESRDRYDVIIGQWKAGGRQAPPDTKTHRVTPFAPAVANVGGPTLTMAIAAYWDHAQVYYRHADGTPTDEV